MIFCNKGHMDDTALNYFGRKFTYRQFDAAIEECARALAARGVEKGEIVSLCMLTMPEVLILLYAVNRVGAVCNFLVLNATEQEMHKQIQLAESRLVFTVSVAAEKVLQAVRGTSVKEVVSIPLSASMPVLTASMARLTHQETADSKGATAWKAFLKGGGNAAFVPVAVGKDDLAVLEYTSGTTGESKGVMLSNQAVNSVAATANLVFERDGTRWMRTGDLGMVTEDGAFRITGRLKRIFWSLGEDGIVYRVYPMKIEEVIARCPEVKQCGVVGMANGKRGYLPVAYVVLGDKDMNQEDIRCRIQEICRKELNPTSQLHELYFMDRLPLTRAGKIDFQELERMAAGRERIE